MSRLVIVSNRVSMPRERSAQAGGLAVALRDALKKTEGMWFGWSGEISEATDVGPHLTKSGRIVYATMDLGAEIFDQYYNSYCNSTLWPLFHYRLGLVEISRPAFDAYLRVNARFADHLMKLLKPDDVIWIHDYQLMALPAELRRRGIRNRIGFFLHIPLPGPDVLSVLPGHRRLMESLAQCDLVGFQTENDLRGFRDYAVHEAGGALLEDGGVEMFGRRTQAGVFPIGIDVDEFAETATAAEGEEETQRLVESLNQRKLVIGVDRLDYSKGIINRIEAIDELLTAYPERRNTITFVQIAAPSRIDVRRYRNLKREIEGAAGRVNGRHAEIDWAPIRYLNRTIARRQIAGFYRVARVGLVTPLRDGMNLVAKEFVAAQSEADPGVLVLSRFAGAARQLSGALIVNPFDAAEVAQALCRALDMPLDERRARWSGMMAGLRANDLGKWRDDFLTALGNTPANHQPQAAPSLAESLRGKVA